MAGAATGAARGMLAFVARRTASMTTSGVAAAAAAPRRSVSQLAGLTSQRPAFAAPAGASTRRNAHLVGAQTETLSAELEFDHDKTTVLFKASAAICPASAANRP